MSRSFYWAKDAQLYTGVANFSTKISASPTSYGLVAAQATSYAAVAATWNAAYQAFQDPTTRTKSRCATKNAARDAVRLATANLAKIISGTPGVSDAQKIDLGLSVRTVPTPATDPGTPNRFGAELSAMGALLLSWKCTSPAGGTMYQVWRKLGEAEPTFLGSTGEKKFVDATLPAGSSAVTYSVQGMRPTGAGAWATFNVKIGVGPAGGAATASVADAPPAKIAA